MMSESSSTCNPRCGRVEQKLGYTCLLASGNRFLWVDLQQGFAKMKMKTDDKIRKALRSLSKDLNETYQKIFSEITGPEEDPADREQALKLFRWLAYS